MQTLQILATATIIAASVGAVSGIIRHILFQDAVKAYSRNYLAQGNDPAAPPSLDEVRRSREFRTAVLQAEFYNCIFGWSLRAAALLGTLTAALTLN